MEKNSISFFVQTYSDLNVLARPTFWENIYIAWYMQHYALWRIKEDTEIRRNTEAQIRNVSVDL